MTNHPGLNSRNTFGDFQGSPLEPGERIAPGAAIDPPIRSGILVLVDEVTFGEGGRWGNWSDGVEQFGID
jgi:hypothetical protein